MLTFAQSITIARRSIKTVSGIPVTQIGSNDTLDRCTISDDLRLRLVKRLACVSQEFGVPMHNHTLEIEALNEIVMSSTVNQFASAIEANAVPNTEENNDD
jgi:hypothetical protein